MADTLKQIQDDEQRIWAAFNRFLCIWQSEPPLIRAAIGVTQTLIHNENLVRELRLSTTLGHLRLPRRARVNSGCIRLTAALQEFMGVLTNIADDEAERLGVPGMPKAEDGATKVEHGRTWVYDEVSGAWIKAADDYEPPNSQVVTEKSPPKKAGKPRVKARARGKRAATG